MGRGGADALGAGHGQGWKLCEAAGRSPTTHQPAAHAHTGRAGRHECTTARVRPWPPGALLGSHYLLAVGRAGIHNQGASRPWARPWEGSARGCVEGEIGWGRREKGEDSPGTAMCRDVCFCAIWIWRGRREVMRWRGGYIEENVRGGCQICHQLCRDRVREAVASATNYARQCQTETESDEW
jgi:hypothetical protein